MDSHVVPVALISTYIYVALARVGVDAHDAGIREGGDGGDLPHIVVVQNALDNDGRVDAPDVCLDGGERVDEVREVGGAWREW
jgi:hypothetical protein